MENEYGLQASEANKLEFCTKESGKQIFTSIHRAYVQRSKGLYLDVIALSLWIFNSDSL